MKRFLLTIALMCALALFVQPVRYLVGDILGLEQPITHQIEKGNWLSKLAVKHYGDASYWKELALVNRAPNPDLIFPQENVIIPSLAAIQKIRQAKSLSDVNSLIDEQEAIIAARTESQQEPVAEEHTRDTIAKSEEPLSGTGQPEMPNQTDKGGNTGSAETLPEYAPETYIVPDESESAANEKDPGSFLSSTPVITGLVILGMIALIAVFMAVSSRKRNEERASYGATSTTEKDDESLWKNRYSYRKEDEERTNGSKKQKKEVVEVK